MAAATRLSIDVVRFSFGKNPGVFASAALGRIDDQGSGPERHAREPSWLNVDVTPVQDVGSQVDVAGLEMISDDRGYSRKRQRRLCDVAAGVLLNALGEFDLLGPGRV